ncbi:hypothetical protein LX32DRAFT_21346 [Colletotrichum zoysiae]|uniref:Uncharacterized protein n=1 Tax=Colletotrichum zoysiae TaxID=1216348 RepID=A0AAD9LZ84_9PEZI|nr:hypothetical protein LX32DRAFT_21346 [Colletotrichum zoysiae]
MMQTGRRHIQQWCSVCLYMDRLAVGRPVVLSCLVFSWLGLGGPRVQMYMLSKYARPEVRDVPAALVRTELSWLSIWFIPAKN